MDAIHTKRFRGANDTVIIGDVGGDEAWPPVLLLHGGGQTRHSWRKAMHSLIANRYHVLSLDARGHGDSGWSNDGDYSFELLAQDLKAVMATLRTRPTLVGASMGGLTALTLLDEDPNAASSLVLVDVVPRSSVAGRERIRTFMRQHADGFASLQEAVEAVQQYNPARRGGNEAGLRKNLRQRADGRLYWHWDPSLLSGLDRVEVSEREARLDRAAARIKIPTLLVRGLLSDVVTDDGVASLKAVMPELEIWNVSEAGHMVAGDENDIFNDAVIAFLQRHRVADQSR